MFEPVPNYYKLRNDENICDKLKAFRERVRINAEQRGVNLENRFEAIFLVCDRLKDLVNEKGIDIWKHPAKEPIEKFQILFQLLIYLLGDRGLLFDEYGAWEKDPAADSDEDSWKISWKNSEDGYLELLWGIRNKHYAYMQLKRLRSDLESRSRSLDYYDKSSNARNLEEIANLTELHTKYLPEIKYAELNTALSILSCDPLCRQAAPLFLFFRPWSSDARNYASAFRSSLRKYNNRLPQIKQPREIMRCCEDWDFYCRCDQFIRKYVNLNTEQNASAEPSSNKMSRRVYPDVNIFVPHLLIPDICNKAGIELSEEEVILLANYSLSLFRGETVEPPTAIASIKISETLITEILEAFTIIWRAPETQFGLNDNANHQIIKRKLKYSLRLLYESGLLGSIEDIPQDNEHSYPPQNKYSDSQYNALLEKTMEVYGVEHYSFSEEAFWLVTGYVPPNNYIPKMNQGNLYARCFYDLHRIWVQYHRILKDSSPRNKYDRVSVNGYLEQNECSLYGTQIGIGVELHRDILKAKCHLASKWDNRIEQLFLGNITSLILEWGFEASTRSSKDIYQKLLQIARTVYDEVKDEKSSYKGLQYNPDLVYSKLLDECFALTEFHLYREVFDTIVLVSRALWPL